MTELKEGMFVKDKTEKYGRTGMLVGLGATYGVVEFARPRIGNRETKNIPVKDLVEMCKVSVWRDYGDSMCGRKAKEDHLCGLHLSHRNRRAAEEEERRQKQAQVDDARAAMTDSIKARGLDDRLAIYNVARREVIVNLDTLYDMLRNA